MMDNPAKRVIEKCGGYEKVAKIAGVHVTRVYRWTYPTKRGGTDGRIPGKHQAKLLAAAKKGGFDLTPADFFARAA